MAKETVPFRRGGLPIATLRAEVIAGPNKGLELDAEQDTITVGTAEGNTLRLTDDTVSRYHADLIREDEHILVLDHGSTNGTLFQRVRIERAAVPPGTLLTLGRTQVRVSAGGRASVQLHDSNELGDLRGDSAVMRRLMAQIERVASTDTSVLLLGESGVGKELFARAIHTLSPRRAEPLVTVDCGSLSPTLIASQLFGHERGAFTGAERRHEGAFERAHGGTVFLDEIGELPPAMQATLLGVLERKRFTRLGSSKELSVDVRLVSATNRDLRTDVNNGDFRLDLFYRVAVATLRVPPLRERIEDIPVLAEFFLHELGYEGRATDLISPDTMAILCQHRWPGNVRELRNVLEATLALGGPPTLVDHAEPAAPNLTLDSLLGLPYKVARRRLLDRFEAHYLPDLMRRAAGNVSEAARQARMDRTYLTSLLRKYDIR